MNAGTQDARVLVVDDESAVRISISRSLQCAGYQVSQASDGEQTLAALRNRHFDVVLGEIRLPGMDGTELLRRIREQSPDAVVILLTGYASTESAVEARRLGAFDYLVKPCSGEELRASVARGVEFAGTHRRRHSLMKALRGNLDELIHANVDLSPEPVEEPGLDEPAEPASVDDAPARPSPGRNLQLGSLTIFPGRYQIEVNDHAVNLTPTEFDLLLYLAAHRERVVSCQELVREVRGKALDEWPARDMIRPHISNLRRKLREHDREVRLVENVRGVGYRLSNTAG